VLQQTCFCSHPIRKTSFNFALVRSALTSPFKKDSRKHCSSYPSFAVAKISCSKAPSARTRFQRVKGLFANFAAPRTSCAVVARIQLAVDLGTR